MKKLTVLFSSFTICALLFFVSCTKDKYILDRQKANYPAAGILDTPYVATNNVAGDTPYIKAKPVFTAFADTPYLGKASVIKSR